MTRAAALARLGALMVLTVGPPLDSTRVLRAGEADEAQEGEAVRTELWAAIGAEGELYLTFRDRLVERGQRVLPVLRNAAQQGKAWQERVMAAVLVERITKPDRIKAVVKWWSEAEVDRDFGTNWNVLGKSLAQQCTDTPMLLVEKVWKNNELRNKRISDYHDGAWEADALGWLAERRALPALISMLSAAQDHDASELRVTLAARALGKLGDPMAVPALCEAYILYSSRRPGSASLEAMNACGDMRSSTVIRRFASRVADEEVKGELLKVAETLRRKPAELLPIGDPR